MATMNIKDPEVHRMAHELAAIRHTSATGAVREALREAIERERERTVEERVARILEIARRGAALPEPFLTDDDLYDEMGAPK